MKHQLRIREAIKAHGLTVNEVAERMGINRVTLSTHLNGNPSAEILFRIADAIGCGMNELFGTDEDHIIVCPKCGTRLTVKEEK